MQSCFEACARNARTMFVRMLLRKYSCFAAVTLDDQVNLLINKCETVICELESNVMSGGVF